MEAWIGAPFCVAFHCAGLAAGSAPYSGAVLIYLVWWTVCDCVACSLVSTGGVAEPRAVGVSGRWRGYSSRARKPSISIRALRGRAATWTTARAGKGLAISSSISELTGAKWCRSIR